MCDLVWRDGFSVFGFRQGPGLSESVKVLICALIKGVGSGVQMGTSGWDGGQRHQPASI